MMTNIDFDAFDFDELELDREIARKSFYGFMQIAWDIAEPAKKFIPAWHIEAIAEHMEAVARGEITRLVINVPPGSTKSMTCSVLFHPWVWSFMPEHKFIFGSFGETIAFRDARRARRVIKSDWYRERWPDVEIMHADDTARRYANDKGGFRYSVTVRGGVTGEHADTQIIDDPIKPLEVTKSMHVASTVLDECETWWHETMSSRLVDYDKSARVIIMQRLHVRDLAGICLDRGYEHLLLPMEFEPKRKCVTSIGFEDPRNEEGELLCPARFSATAVEGIKEDLGPRGAEAQLQQNPVAQGGNIIKEQWIQFYDRLPKCSRYIQSWDCAFKGKEDSNFVVGQIWGQKGAEFYLVDQIRGRMDFPSTLSAIKSLSLKYPTARAKLIEDKSNGPAVIDTLKKKLTGLIAVNPEGGKEARVHSISHLWEAGNVFLPSPQAIPDKADMVNNFVFEVVRFDSGENDDQVDAMSQALVYLEKGGYAKLKEAMDKVKTRGYR